MAASGDDLFKQAIDSFRAGRLDDAERQFKAVLARQPRNVMALDILGALLASRHKYSEAEPHLRLASKLNSHSDATFYNHGIALNGLGRPAEALRQFDKAIALKPNLERTWLAKGDVLHRLRRDDEALEAYNKALALKPSLVEAWLGRGNVFYQRMRYGEALAAYERALASESKNAQAWLGYGNALTGLERYHDALAAHDKALVLAPDLAGAWIGRGNALMGQKRYDEALLAHDKAIERKHDIPEAWVGRGNVLYKMTRFDDAIEAYDKALALTRNLAAAWLGRGNVCFERKRYNESCTAYDNAAAINPGLPEAWRGRGNVLAELQRYVEAIMAYDKALALKPDWNDVAGPRLSCKMTVCDWSNYEIECADLISSIRGGHAVTSPFPLLSTPASSADQLQCAKLWVASEFPPVTSMIDNHRYGHDRIRLAYLSADFRDHPVAQALAELLEQHDRSCFETVGLSIGTDDGGVLRARIVKAFDQFHDVRLKSDYEAARLIRELEIDVLVKVAPHTQDSRLGILAQRPAPIQVNGFSAWTSGADFIDYVLADRHALPFNEQPYYTERIVHLPDSYFPHDSTQQIAANAPTRAEVGLPEDAFVFCSFNRSYKFNPRVFDAWMRILKRVDGSVLWLMQNNPQATINLRREAAARGIASSRLVFAPRAPLLSDHLARHRLADVFLDTLPYGAHTTAKDALWAGLPVLTCRGDTFVGRIAASQMFALGLPELVTDSLDEYEATALRLAQNPNELLACRDMLAANRQTYPLFDTARLCRHFEAAYIEMWKRHQRGERPQSFAVNAD